MRAHYVGQDMKTTLVRAAPQAGEPAEQCLLHTPNWDFGWQRIHRFDTAIEDAVRFSTGDKFRLECTYNNTLANTAVATALADQGKTEPEDVTIGDTTLDEMCLTVVGAAYRVAP